MGRVLVAVVGEDEEVGEGKRSKRKSQSSMMSCLEGRSPGFFSEKRRVESEGKGSG